ncbi:dTMP kinase [Paraferrimonas sedimenticola]|uniref:Thymidylate kinase n=1 Tax=Paraferrimonas sedimenticola TaxID=375674 RepID=A0AA37RYY2_9GAMM|nr:dTMP kinase [Paraferrimonas sedimenticola]GLP98085.1 thymidylate kinase [Paraferrimonas sedimenticola]
MKAQFIVIEGLEGAGKSTAIATVKAVLESHGITDVITTREPGGTPVAERIRAITKEEVDGDPLSDTAECLLMYAARAQLVDNLIKPALAKGTWVIGDRHDLSSRAYQGGGRKLGKLVDDISDVTLQGFKPDLTLYMDIDPAQGLARAAGRGELDRIERQALDFFERTREAYLRLAAADDSIVTIDAGRELEVVTAQIRDSLNAHLGA